MNFFCTQSRWARLGHLALRGLTLLSLLCILLLGSAAFWLHRDPQAIAARLAEEIQQRTGIQCSLGAVDVVLLPVPSLGIADIQMHTAEVDFTVAFATVRPALWPLLHGQFTPSSVTLLRPVVHCKLPAARGDSTPVPPTTPVSAATPLPLQVWATLQQGVPAFLHGMNLHIQHGSLHGEFAAGHTLESENISTTLHMAPGGPTGSLSLGQTVWRKGQVITASVDALQLDLDGPLLHLRQGADASARLDTRLNIPGLVQGLQVRLHATQSSSLADVPHMEIQADIQGGLMWAGAQRGTSTVLPVSVQAKGRSSRDTTVQVEDFRIALAQDRLRGNAEITLHGDPQSAGPRLSGTLDIERLSLVQWFGFARRLPPGLQHTLHQIQGSLRFDMSPQGLDVTHITVHAADGTFTGKGGVPLWGHPVITLDLSAPQLTLGKAFAEAEGHSPPPLTFAHAPLTPEPGTEAADSLPGPDIDYDINLRVENLAVWQLAVGNVNFRCIPAVWSAGASKTETSKPSPASTKGSVLMTFGVGQLYGGRGEGQLVLSTPAPGKTGYGIKASLRNVIVEQLLSRLNTTAAKAGISTASLPSTLPSPLTGRLQLDTEFTAQGQSLSAFFASQEGSLTLRIDNGHVLYDADKKEKLPFTRMRLEAKVHSGDQGQSPRQVLERTQGQSTVPRLRVASLPGVVSLPGVTSPLPAGLTYTGQWKVSLDAPRLKATFQMEGPVFFSTKHLLPVQWRKIPGHLMVEADTNLLSEWQLLPSSSGNGTKKIDISGRFSLHSGERSFAVEDAQASLPDLGDLQVRGHVQGAAPSQGIWLESVLEGQVSSARALLRPFLPSLVDSLPSTTLRRAEGKARLTYKDKNLTLTDMRLKVDNLTTTGRLSGVWKERPTWTFDLDVDTLNLDAYVPPRKPVAHASGTTEGRTIRQALPTAPLWKLDWMRHMDAQGQLRIQTAQIRKFTLHQARIPLQLRNATLACAALRGDIYGAPLTGSFTAEATQGLKLHLTVEAQGLNMRNLSEERQMDTLLAGQGALWATVQGTARAGADIPGVLDGAWSLLVTDAYTQPRQAKGPASRTQLGEIRASGSLEKGILRSDNLTITGATLQARGSGWVNMEKDTLDVGLTVNMFRIPEFPVRFYGNLDNPQRSINAGKAIASTLGNLGFEVVDVLGNVIGGALRLLP